MVANRRRGEEPIPANHKELLTMDQIDGLRKQGLLKGLDDLGLTAEKLPEIEAFQQQDRTDRPWIWL